jgi:hypothetical protein
MNKNKGYKWWKSPPPDAANLCEILKEVYGPQLYPKDQVFITLVERYWKIVSYRKKLKYYWIKQFAPRRDPVALVSLTYSKNPLLTLMSEK